MYPEERVMGRLYIPDDRDSLYPVSGILPKAANITEKYWYDDAYWGDQGSTPQCVAYAWTHWLNDGPKLFSLIKERRPGVNQEEIYCEAQKIDPWVGDCENPQYEGTSVRAGAAVLKKRGLISEYRWINSMDELVTTLLTVGPVVAGTNWYSDMYYPQNGVISVGGHNVGGHAYLLNGVNTETGMIRIKNSWGRYWGEGGHAFISMEDFSTLFSQWGDCCIGLR